MAEKMVEAIGAASGAGICGCRKRMRGVAESLLPEYDWVKMSERPHEKGIFRLNDEKSQKNI